MASGTRMLEMKAAKLKRVYTVVADKRGAEVKYLCGRDSAASAGLNDLCGRHGGARSSS